MCKSQAEGGRRCAAHTRTALESATAAYNANPTIENEDRLAEARAQHASTDGGYEEIGLQLRDLNRSDPQHAALARACTRGSILRNAYLDAENQIKWEPKAASRSAAAQVEALRAQSMWGGNNLSDETLDNLSWSTDLNVLCALAAYRGKLPANVVERLALHDDPDVRHELAKSGGSWRNANAAHNILARSTPADRVELAKRWGLPADVVGRLASDPDPRVRAALLYCKPTGHQLAVHRDRSKSYVVAAFADPSAKVRLAALNAWNSAGLQTRWDGDQQVCEVWAAPDAATIDALTNDPSAAVRKRASMVFADTDRATIIANNPSQWPNGYGYRLVN